MSTCTFTAAQRPTREFLFVSLVRRPNGGPKNPFPFPFPIRTGKDEARAYLGHSSQALGHCAAWKLLRCVV